MTDLSFGSRPGSGRSERQNGPITPTHVLIDLDGTLTDSEPGIAASLRRALALEGVPVPDDAVLRTAIGPPFELGLPLIGVPPSACGRSSTATASATRTSACSRAGSTTAWSRCSTSLADRGLVLSLATAKPELTARRIVEHFGLTDRFAVLAGATFEPGRRTKARSSPTPSPSSVSTAVRTS